MVVYPYILRGREKKFSEYFLECSNKFSSQDYKKCQNIFTETFLSCRKVTIFYEEMATEQRDQEFTNNWNKPVILHIVSRPDKSVMWMKVSLKEA